MNIILWFLGAFFFLGGLTSFSNNFLSSIISLTIASLLIPPVFKEIDRISQSKISNLARTVFILLLIFVGGLLNTNNQVQKNNVDVNNGSKPTVINIETSYPIKQITLIPKPTNTKIPTIKPTNIPTPTLYEEPNVVQAPIYINQPVDSNTSSYSCNCSKTCNEMWSCEEAYYQLDTCGCYRRDGDGDGVPCENLCN